MTRVGIIGGTGAGLLVPAGVRTLPAADTRWGLPSGPCLSWQQAGVEVVYLPRHGADGAEAPHRASPEKIRESAGHWVGLGARILTCMTDRRVLSAGMIEHFQALPPSEIKDNFIKVDPCSAGGPPVAD